MKRLMWMFIIIISFTLLVACGLKGPLYFPSGKIIKKTEDVFV